jgi:hypothetical protein
MHRLGWIFAFVLALVGEVAPVQEAKGWCDAQAVDVTLGSTARRETRRGGNRLIGGRGRAYA